MSIKNIIKKIVRGGVRIRRRKPWIIAMHTDLLRVKTFTAIVDIPLMQTGPG